ncbi:MAG: hypothetical protein Ta2F_08860 [Termitinemataceae bacterium]|nr:MAG: hypothetical protein Ta2F_08860 [Termitinemataceae bacterium]
MKKNYVKPAMYCEKQPAGIVPVAAIAAALGVSQAVAGLAMGAAAGVVAVGGGVAAGKALAKKHHFDSWECLPSLDPVCV